jgi:hypothetical protein
LNRGGDLKSFEVITYRRRPIVFKEWRDTMTFSNLQSTHCTLLILLIINLVTNKSVCIISKVQIEQ